MTEKIRRGFTLVNETHYHNKHIVALYSLLNKETATSTLFLFTKHFENRGTKKEHITKCFRLQGPVML